MKEEQGPRALGAEELRLRVPGRRITINLAPADMKKEGSAFDLPIALGILAASGQLPREELRSYAILGELSLDGRGQGGARRPADRRRRARRAACAASCSRPPTRAKRRWCRAST